jgi:hypothetical protein
MHYLTNILLDGINHSAPESPDLKLGETSDLKLRGEHQLRNTRLNEPTSKIALYEGSRNSSKRTRYDQNLAPRLCSPDIATMPDIPKEDSVHPTPHSTSQSNTGLDPAGHWDLPLRTHKPSTWTDCIPRTDHNAIFLDCDYSSTTMGPKSEWGPSLRAFTTMAFADSRGACIYWGPNKVAIYNEPFAVSCEKAHPFLMGKSCFVHPRHRNR